MNVRTVVISLGVILGIIAAVIAIGHFYADIITPNSLVTIQGTVIDEKNNPVADVLVTVDGQSDITDINGKYVIQNVPGGVKTIVAKKESPLYKRAIILKKSDIILTRDIIITSPIPTPTSTPSPTPTPTSTPSPTPTPTSTPSPTPTPTSTPSPVVTPTQTPLHEPKYSHGDVVQKKYPKYPATARLILDYSPDADKYKTTLIHEVNGVWLYRSEDENWWSREFIEDTYMIKVGHVDVSKVMSWEEYWEGGGYEKAYATPTSTPSKAGRWHSVITFTGSGDKITVPFTIKGDEWRVKWSIKGDPDYTYFYVYVYPRGQTSGSVSNWRYEESFSEIHYINEEASDIQYIYEGTGDYYFKIGAANLDSWKLEVEDYY